MSLAVLLPPNMFGLNSEETQDRLLFVKLAHAALHVCILHCILVRPSGRATARIWECYYFITLDPQSCWQLWGFYLTDLVQNGSVLQTRASSVAVAALMKASKVGFL